MGVAGLRFSVSLTEFLILVHLPFLEASGVDVFHFGRSARLICECKINSLAGKTFDCHNEFCGQGVKS